MGYRSLGVGTGFDERPWGAAGGRNLMMELLAQDLIDRQMRRCISQRDRGLQNMAFLHARYAPMGGQSDLQYGGLIEISEGISGVASASSVSVEYEPKPCSSYI